MTESALTAIRRARPIAAISYAGDALDWWHRVSDTLAAVAKRQRAEVAAWHRANPIDMVRVIRTMCSHEDNVRPPRRPDLCAAGESTSHRRLLRP